MYWEGAAKAPGRRRPPESGSARLEYISVWLPQLLNASPRWAPLASGVLTGKYTREETPPPRARGRGFARGADA